MRGIVTAVSPPALTYDGGYGGVPDTEGVNRD